MYVSGFGWVEDSGEPNTQNVANNDPDGDGKLSGNKVGIMG